ncbi:MAG: hypothetical protein HFJ27_00110 [Clostridia bacterium]|nr:hypothetical protein [Clostridia bacterium]
MKKLKKWIQKNQNKILVVIFIAIILLQVATRIQYGQDKVYLHIDEGYSYGLMNYNKVDIMNNDDFYDTWHEKEYYQDYLSISAKEAMDFSPVYENQKNDVHPPFYYLLLRIAASFTIDSFSKWTGIILNIIIFILTCIFIYLISNKIFQNKVYAIFMVLVNGFTLCSIDTTIFIRMYALNALNLLIIVYWHIKNWNNQNLTIKDLTVMAIAIIIGSLTHYYYLVFLFILFIIYLIKWITQRSVNNVIKYLVTMIISGIVSLVIFPYSFVHMFMGYRGTGAFANLLNIEQMWNSFGKYLAILNNNGFNGTLAIIIAIAFIIAIYKILKDRKITLKFKNKEFWVMCIPTVIYFTIIALVSPYQELRYIMPVCPLLLVSVFYLLKVVLEGIFSIQNTYKILTAVFIVMLILPIIMPINFYYLYKDKKEIVSKIEQEHTIPCLYIFNKNQNRFLDDLYLFTILDTSYIMDVINFNETIINQAFQNVNLKEGLIVIINEGIEHDTYLKQLLEILKLEEYKHIQRMNACDIYRLK